MDGGDQEEVITDVYGEDWGTGYPQPLIFIPMTVVLLDEAGE